MKWNIFVAIRYYLSRRTSTVNFSVFSIAVGVAALIIVISVMNGFQTGFIESILELNSFHIRLQIPHDKDSGEIIEKIYENKSVSTAVPINNYQTLAESSYRGMQVIKIISIGSGIYQEDSSFAGHMSVLSGRFDISQKDTIVIGEQLANVLGVYVGDRIRMLDYVKSFSTGYREYTITGIFKSGYWDYDSTLAYTGFNENLSTMARTENITIGIKLKKSHQDQRVISWLKGEFPDYKTVSWREYNKAFFGALRMEKIVMFMLIGLIFILVGVNIYNSLKRSVFEKRDEIGVMLAMGSRHDMVKNIFVYDGSIIGFIGALFGLISGLFLSVYINEVVAIIEIIFNTFIDLAEKMIKPISDIQLNHISIFSPAEYYLDKLPTKIIFQEVLLIFLFGVFSAVLAASRASGKVLDIEPAQIIREE